MQHKILMPKLGLTMKEGVISEWMVAVGSPVKPDAGLFVVETDKVATEVPAEGNGVLTEILAQPGATVAVGEVVGYWSDSAEEPAASPEQAATGETARRTAEPQQKPAPLEASLQPRARLLSTPLARRLASQLGVDLQTVRGSGARGVIKAYDVRAAQSAVPVATAPPLKSAFQPGAIDLGTRSRPDAVTAAMARRLTAAKQEIPHFYLSVEVEVSRLLALRTEVNALSDSIRLTLNHFIVAAVGRALCDLPHVNRVWADGEIVSYGSTDVGVAVNTERGLYVPVVRDAGRLHLADAARRTQELVDAARNGRLKPDDMAGGAITVSNAGMFNVKFMTPIINPGQAMILGVGSVSELFRPDAEGKPALRKEMGLVLAGDHRLLDGVAGLTFLNRVTAYLGQPMKLLLGA